MQHDIIDRNLGQRRQMRFECRPKSRNYRYQRYIPKRRIGRAYQQTLAANETSGGPRYDLSLLPRWRFCSCEAGGGGHFVESTACFAGYALAVDPETLLKQWTK